jgi:hypothetical protein
MLVLAGGAIAAVVVAALAYFLVIAKDDAPKNALDPARADELSAASIIGVRDLPGSGWKLVEADIFDDSDEPPADTTACKDADAISQPIEDRLDAVRAGRAQRKFEVAGTGGNLDRSVEISTIVYQDNKELTRAFEGLRTFFAAEDTMQCFEDIFTESTAGVGQLVSVKRIDPTAGVPAGGAALALDVVFQVSGFTFNQRLENYSWPFGNAVAELSFTGTPNDITSSLTADVIAKQKARLEQTGTDNPPLPESIAALAPTPAPTSQPGRTPTAVVTRPAATPGPAASATVRPFGTPITGGTAPSGLTRLADLNSYKYTLKIEGNGAFLSEAFGGLGLNPANGDLRFEASGSYVKPDRGEQIVRFGDQLTVNVVTIGRQQWSGVGGVYALPDSFAREATDYSLATSFWDAGFIDSAGELQCAGGREAINGIATRTCGIDSNAFAQLGGLLGGLPVDEDGVKYSDIAFRLWIADPGGHLVRLRMDMAGTDPANQPFRLHLEADITDINSTAITINPPAGR